MPAKELFSGYIPEDHPDFLIRQEAQSTNQFRKLAQAAFCGAVYVGVMWLASGESMRRHWTSEG